MGRAPSSEIFGHQSLAGIDCWVSCAHKAFVWHLLCVRVGFDSSKQFFAGVSLEGCVCVRVPWHLCGLSCLPVGRIPKFNACIQFPAAEAACVWSLFRISGSPWQRPASCWPLWRQITLGFHSDSWETGSAEGNPLCFKPSLCSSEDLEHFY